MNITIGKNIILSAAIFFIVTAFTDPVHAGQDEDSAAAIIYDYAVELYRSGRVSEAIQQLNAALAVRPGYPRAIKKMDEIIAKHSQPSGGSQQQSAVEEQEGLNQYNDIIGSAEEFKQEPDSSARAWDKKDELGLLQGQMFDLEKEKSSYQEQAAALDAVVSDKENERQKLLQEIQALKDQHAEELESKEEDLIKAKLDYENRLIALGGELKAKEAQIDKLKEDEAQAAQEKEKIEQQESARVEKLMEEIEDVFPDKKELQSPEAGVSPGQTGATDPQTDRIDDLMEEVKELLPGSGL